MAEFILIEKKEESKQDPSPFGMEDKLLFMKCKCLTMYDFLKHETEMDTDLSSDARWGLAYLFQDCADMFDLTIKELVGIDFDEVDRAKNSYDSILRRGYPYREGLPAEHLNDLYHRVNEMVATVEQKKKILERLQGNIIQKKHEILESDMVNQVSTQEN